MFDNMAGSRATEACEPRQVRKEAAVAMSAMCCGKPGHQKTNPLALAEFAGVIFISIGRKNVRCVSEGPPYR